MRGGAVRIAGRCFGLTVATGMSAAVGAQTSQTGLLVSTGVSAESNPYNGAGGNAGSIAATAELQPQARFRTESATLDLNGLAQFRQFVRRYGLEDNYSGNAQLTSRVSERLTVHASGGASYNQGGYSNYGRAGLSPSVGFGGTTLGSTTTDDALPDVSIINGSLADQIPLLTDVTVLGLRTRTTSFQAGTGFNAQITGRSQLAADLQIRALRFKTLLLNDYDNASVELRWSRSLNELTSLGIIVSTDLTNYRASRVGDARTKTALLSYDRRFGSRWALSLGAGASFTNINQLAGLPDTRFTALSVRGQFCRQGEYSQVCVSANRSPQPAANGNVRVTNSIAATYSLRLTDRERITLSGSYAQTERGRGTALALPAADFASASARYDRQIGQRMGLFMSGNIAKFYGASSSRSANIGVAAGVQFRLGALN